MVRTALRSLLSHKVRLLASALAVTIGVAFMAGTLVLSDTIQQTFDGLFANVYQGTDAVVRSSSAVGVDGGPSMRVEVPDSLVATVGSHARRGRGGRQHAGLRPAHRSRRQGHRRPQPGGAHPGVLLGDQPDAQPVPHRRRAGAGPGR